MKPIRFPEDHIAARFSSLATVGRRISRIRGDYHEDENEDGSEKTNEEPEVESGGSVRVIQIRGVLMRDCEGWFPWATDTEEIEELLEEAENDNNVSAVVLDIDSPGGAVNGSVELAEFVAGMTKPVVTYTAGDCCSAAYWIAASSDLILIRSTSTVASVGVYSALLDVSVMYEQLGVKTELFKSGDQKAAGYPGTTLTDAQRAVIQGEVDALGDQFRTAVIGFRPEVDIEMLDGRSVSGIQAIEAGFADDFANNIGAAVEAAKSLGGM